MNIETTPAPNHQARRKKYIDKHIQGRLIAGLLVLEVVLFAVAMWFVYQQLQNAIDANLYRVHQPDTDSNPVLIDALVRIVPLIVLVNALILIGIDRLWGNYLQKIVGPLRQMIEKISCLELHHVRDNKADHAVLEHAGQWIEQEQKRCSAIRQQVQLLPEQVNPSDHAQLKELTTVLTNIKQQLP